MRTVRQRPVTIGAEIIKSRHSRLRVRHWKGRHWFIYASLLFDLGTTASSILSVVVLSDLNSYVLQTAVQDRVFARESPSRRTFARVSLPWQWESHPTRKFGLGRIWELARSRMTIRLIMDMVSRSPYGRGPWRTFKCLSLYSYPLV